MAFHRKTFIQPCLGMDWGGYLLDTVEYSEPDGRQSTWEVIEHTRQKAHTIRKPGCNSDTGLIVTVPHSLTTKIIDENPKAFFKKDLRVVLDEKEIILSAEIGAEMKHIKLGDWVAAVFQYMDGQGV